MDKMFSDIHLKEAQEDIDRLESDIEQIPPSLWDKAKARIKALLLKWAGKL